MYIFVQYLRVFCVFCLIFMILEGSTVFRKVSLGAKIAKMLNFGVLGWRLSSGRCESVLKRCGMCSWSKVRRKCIFLCDICVYFAYLTSFFMIFGGLDGLSQGVVGRENSENCGFGGVGLTV